MTRRLLDLLLFPPPGVVWAGVWICSIAAALIVLMLISIKGGCA